MDTLQALSLAMGTAWTSGINLYATVAALGIAGRTEMIQLPPDLQVLTHPAVIAVACVMYLIEFFADKVPYVDNGWDVLHTFIRVPAGAILAARTLGDVNPALELAAVLAGGTIAFAAHGTKMATRLALNVSPGTFQQLVRQYRRRPDGVREHLDDFPSSDPDAHLDRLFSRPGRLAGAEVITHGEARLSSPAGSTARGQTGSASAHGFTATRLERHGDDARCQQTN